MSKGWTPVALRPLTVLLRILQAVSAIVPPLKIPPPVTALLPVRLQRVRMIDPPLAL
jgi:hypothetical protein